MNRGRLIRWILIVLPPLFIAWACWDFTRFVEHTAHLEPPTTTPHTAVVALTGGAGIRIAAGIDLIETADATRLLISGVNESTSIDDLVNLSGGDLDTYNCCVDIGRKARSTVQNADETAEWVAANKFETIIVVTSDFHMPRALILLKRELPGITLIPYPVTTGIDPKKTWHVRSSFKGMLREWAKWRVTHLI